MAVVVVVDWVDIHLGVLDSVMLWDTNIASLLFGYFKCLILFYMAIFQTLY